MKGLLILYNNFEDCEAIVTRAVLKNNNLNIISATDNQNLNVISATNLKIKADLHLKNINYSDYNFLIIPGGPYVKNIIDQNKEELKTILSVIKNFNNHNKVIGTICAAPAFLGKLNLLKGKKFICYPGYEIFIEGIYCANESSIISDNLITSRSPDTVFDFAFKLIEKLTF